MILFFPCSVFFFLILVIQIENNMCSDTDNGPGDGCLYQGFFLFFSLFFFLIQIEDNVCNGTDNGPGDGCLYQGASAPSAHSEKSSL